MTCKEFIRNRAKKIAQEARANPATCQVARNWLELARKQALKTDLQLAYEIEQLNKGIL